jgi:hypothetical protein
MIKNKNEIKWKANGHVQNWKKRTMTNVKCERKREWTDEQ